MTADGKPFFAGTYFAPEPGRGMISFPALLELIHESWTDNTDRLIDQANQLIQQLNINTQSKSGSFEFLNFSGENSKTSDKAVLLYKKIFDNINGGFGFCRYSTEAESYLLGQGMFLYALEEYLNTGSYVCTEHWCSRACHRA